MQALPHSRWPTNWAVAKAIAKLQAEDRIRRVGPDKGGHWEVLKDE